MRFVTAVALAVVMLWVPVDGVAQRNEYGSGTPYLVSGTVDADRTEFCDGFEAGYKTGYMQTRNTTRPPRSPRCPRQPRKRRGDPQSDYEHGYTIGYPAGVSEGRRRSPED
jgi:hypothetical protein